MAKHNREIKSEIITPPVDEAIVAIKENIPAIEEPIASEPIALKERITLNEYLANYFGGNRNLDKPIVLWYQKKDPMNMKQEKEYWDRIIQEFLAE